MTICALEVKTNIELFLTRGRAGILIFNSQIVWFVIMQGVFEKALEYIWWYENSYTLILTGAAFVSRYNIEKYWSKAYDAAREIVHEAWNCEDILMNVVIETVPMFVQTYIKSIN